MSSLLSLDLSNQLGNFERHGMNRKQRREMMREIQSEDLSLEVVHPDAAGIDIGNESPYVAVPPSRDSQPVRRFGCTTGELKTMANWRKQCRVRTVAMQSTGVYWIAVFDILEEADLEVYLVNARDTKNLPGRKSDVQESQWLMKLHTYGLLRNSMRLWYSGCSGGTSTTRLGRNRGHIPPLSAERLNTGACPLAVTDSPVTSKREWSLP